MAANTECSKCGRIVKQILTQRQVLFWGIHDITQNSRGLNLPPVQSLARLLEPGDDPDTFLCVGQGLAQSPLLFSIKVKTDGVLATQGLLPT